MRPRPDPTRTMSFGDHLEELRRRVILGLLGIVPVFLLALALARPLLALLLSPVQRSLRAAGLPAALQATGPLETFATYFRLAVIATVLLGSPWLLYQAWLFVAPGLYATEKRFVHLLLPFSAVLTAISVVFLYFVLLPVVLTFFIGFGAGIGTERVRTEPPPAGVALGHLPVLQADPPAPGPGDAWVNARRSELRIAVPHDQRTVVLATPLAPATAVLQQYRISEYVRLFLSLALAFAAGFQMPLVVLLLGWAGIVDQGTLRRYRRHAVLICAVAAAVLTPADPLSMILLGVPLYLLYELGILLLRVLTPARVASGLLRRERRAGDE